METIKTALKLYAMKKGVKMTEQMSCFKRTNWKSKKIFGTRKGGNNDDEN